jgi:hypothetical protein
MEDIKEFLKAAESIPYPGDAVMLDLLKKVGVKRSLLELRAITLGYLASFKNQKNTADMFYSLIRGDQDLVDKDPGLIGEYAKTLIGLKNETARWDVTKKIKELNLPQKNDPVAYIDRRLAEAELFNGLMLDGQIKNLSSYKDVTQKHYPALLQVLDQLQAIKKALQAGEMEALPETAELLESYGQELWSIMILLKNAEAGEVTERKAPRIMPGVNLSDS